MKLIPDPYESDTVLGEIVFTQTLNNELIISYPSQIPWLILLRMRAVETMVVWNPLTFRLENESQCRL